MEKLEMVYQPERCCELLYSGMYKGYEFYVVSYGTHPCGYVAIPQGNSLYDKDYDDIDISCHGGLTYSDKGLHEINIQDWVIGWDYHHCSDYSGYGFEPDGKKWTTDEIIDEAKCVIDQICDLEQPEQEDIMEFNIWSAGHINTSSMIREYGEKIRQAGFQIKEKDRRVYILIPNLKRLMELSDVVGHSLVIERFVSKKCAGEIIIYDDYLE